MPTEQQTTTTNENSSNFFVMFSTSINEISSTHHHTRQKLFPQFDMRKSQIEKLEYYVCVCVKLLTNCLFSIKLSATYFRNFPFPKWLITHNLIKKKFYRSLSSFHYYANYYALFFWMLSIRRFLHMCLCADQF